MERTRKTNADKSFFTVYGIYSGILYSLQISLYDMLLNSRALLYPGVPDFNAGMVPGMAIKRNLLPVVSGGENMSEVNSMLPYWWMRKLQFAPTA